MIDNMMAIQVIPNQLFNPEFSGLFSLRGGSAVGAGFSLGKRPFSEVAGHGFGVPPERR